MAVVLHVSSQRLARALRLPVAGSTRHLLQCRRELFWGNRTPPKGDDGGGSGSGDGKGNEDGHDGVSGNAPSSGSGASVKEDASPKDGAIVPVSVEGRLRKDGGSSFEPHLIALPLPRRPLFPGQQQLLQVTHSQVVKELMDLMEKGTPPFIGAFLRQNVPHEASEGRSDEHPEDLSGVDALEVLHNVGTRARILQIFPIAQGKVGQMDGMQMLLHGHDVVRIDKVLSTGPPTRVKVAKVRYTKGDDSDNLKAHINETMHTIREIMKINPQFREHANMIHHGLERLERGDPHAIAHFAASLTTATGAELMQVLETDNPAEKLSLALLLVKKELELSQLQAKIATQIEEKVSTQQREYMLREQMRMIKKELGEDKSDGTDKLLNVFRERLEAKTVPKDVKDAIDAEIEKFSNLAKESQEYQMTRNYLDWLTMLPWGVHSADTLNLAKAREILDRDHYGLSDVKERILELIAVGILRGSIQGKILCFVGPPGVGKTSIGRSIAEALGRQFYRFSVGGLYDVAEIKGHRRTYVGAMPGKMIQCLKKAQTANPLVLIDEVDKIGRGHQGDPASALLELLDPSQNSSFLDHYLDVPVDCSRVLFVCTANVTDTIPGPLLDRMEVIRLSGYDLQEKLHIAQDYLVPSAMREAGLWPPVAAEKSEAADKVEGPAEEGPAAAGFEVPTAPETPQAAVAFSERATIDKSAIEALIRWYCREAGVRNLQKHIERICRKLAAKAVAHHEANSVEAGESRSPREADAADPQEAVGGAASAETSAAEFSESEKLLVTETDLGDYVGKPVFTSDRLYEGKLPPGTVTGLAWTALGGSVLYVEATALARQESAKSAPTLGVTGQLGGVMKESSQLALLLARRQLRQRAPEGRAGFFEENELHLHCPEGATPKDGPSAGVTMVTALMSLALDLPVPTDLAMTGEVSLNGKVMAVGGIKEKTIAARRAGCRKLCFPSANRRDFEELPEYVREGLEVHFASEYDEVFAIVFEQPSNGDGVSATAP